jgi:peptidyl-prolyl cis-trans isomerase C
MRREALAAFVVTGTLLAQLETRADDGGFAADARRGRAVAQIGSGHAITVGELEDRIAALPPFQRTAFGSDAASVRRAFLEQVLVPDVLESTGAETQKLGDQLPTSNAIARARSQATIRAIRQRLGPESAIPMEDVEKYYDANRGRFDAPERIQIWRILCKTREEAQSVLDLVKKEPTPKVFGDLARDHSADKSSNLRGGNLGFVGPDGASSEPGWRVDLAVVRAAQGVRDGELVAAPVQEGEYFSVVWRRGTIAASRHKVEEVAAQIRDTLWKARIKEETDKLVARLRAAKLRDLDTSPLDGLAPRSVDASSDR